MEECAESGNEREFRVETTGRPSDQARHATEAWYLSVDVIEHLLNGSLNRCSSAFVRSSRSI